MEKQSTNKGVETPPPIDDLEQNEPSAEDNLLGGFDPLHSPCHPFFISRDIFVRILCIIFFVSFLGHYNQDPGLIGDHGVWPAREHLTDASNETGFTMFNLAGFLPNNDVYICVLAIVGMILSLVMLCTHMAGTWMCLALWLIKLALITMRSTLPKHNIDLLLLEVGFLAALLYSPFAFFGYEHKEWGVPSTSRWSYYFLLYRGMFCAGVDRIRQGEDPTEAGSDDLKNLMEAIPLSSTITQMVYDFLSGSSVLTTIISSTPLFVELVASVSLIIPIRKCRIIGGFVALFYTLFLGCVSENGSYYLLLASTSILCFDDYFWEEIGCGFLNSLVKHEAEHTLEDLAESRQDDESAPIPDSNSIPMTTPQSLKETIINLLTYKREKQWLGKTLFSRDSFGIEMTEGNYHKWQRAIQVILICGISMFVLDIMVERNSHGTNAIVVFFLSLLLQVQCNVLGTRSSYLKVAGTLFAIHMWLVIEMMIGGVHWWNALLWIGTAELQLGLCNSKTNFYTVANLMIQSVLGLIILYYAVPVVILSLKSKANKASIMAPFGIVNRYDSSEVIGERAPDVIIQGTSDDIVTTGTKWKSYGLHTVPTDPDSLTVNNGGYVYEIDNLLRDVAKKQQGEQATVMPRFLLSLLRALLLNKPAALGLFATNPFRESPPKYVRVIQYNYTISGARGKPWHIRRKRTQIVPPLTLREASEITTEKETSETKQEEKQTDTVETNHVEHGKETKHLKGLQEEDKSSLGEAQSPVHQVIQEISANNRHSGTAQPVA
ncbi:Lipase maturation factor family protein [Babesia bovis T2Bo]|uniref:Uncharacterized protein n=1 Tax=Babesia bovis TaxID=5865 RepID=A7AW74_BABBO|nr:Lipase maturation factor family protein [Babesia bovis T2Bo]EDO05302.1 Lipase maturation factor family protein [Babesia bovis T2Bo]|eukprot:XP_001608870.1 hypothetical protein [Babesia bovis T2Bo]